MTMLNKLLPLLFLLFFSIHQVKAQSNTISVGPLLSCSLTTFTCPGVSGCCTIGGCCGGGCCANGYTCINEGTSAEACCPAFDSTKCGTAPSPSSSGSGSGSGGHTCTTIQNCPPDPDSGLGWTCLLGKTCGFSYNECNPCPYIGGGSSPSTSSSSGSQPTSSSSSGSSPSSSSASGNIPSSGSSSSASSEFLSRDGRLRLHWLAAVSFGGVLGIAV
ncbi:hypothetical protein N431DRAFT_437755 [Stipitochalara longipes BDJ]|nr:hypothetical protein N431DRAFT_437755 [Stipitochalara longipes BDJ]